MTPTDRKTLNQEHDQVAKDSKDFVALVRLGNSRVNKYHLFVDGLLVQEITSARAMSFLDGWKLAQQFSDTSNKPKALLLKTEDPIVKNGSVSL